MSHLSDIHTYIRTHKTIRDVARQHGKRYPRFPQVTLPHLTPHAATLTEVLGMRLSTVAPMKQASLSLESISQLLGHSMGIRSDGQRPHPSGGARYPIEAYLFSFNVENLHKASFHYSPEKHCLEELWKLPAGLHPLDMIHDQNGHAVHAAAVIILTAVWERSTARYSTFAFAPILIEAGHIGQNIALLATALNLTHRPFAGFKDEMVSDLLDLDTKEEQVIYSFALGT